MADQATDLARLGLAVMAAAEVPNFLAGLLPSLMTIGRFAAEPRDRAKLRRGEVVGSALSLAIGVGASLIANDPLPFVMTAGVLLILLWEYERAIAEAQAPGSGAMPINQQGLSWNPS